MDIHGSFIVTTFRHSLGSGAHAKGGLNFLIDGGALFYCSDIQA